MGQQILKIEVREGMDQARMLQQSAEDLTGPSAFFFGFMGAAVALVFGVLGSAYGTAKAGVGAMSMGVMNPSLIIKGAVPTIMAGIFGIYGLIIAILIAQSIPKDAVSADGTVSYRYSDGYRQLASGLCCGFSGLGAGMCIGIVGDAGVRAFGQQEKIYVGMLLVLIFAEALGLYGF